MRTLVIGDIHGCLKALETLVDFVSPNEGDTIITLGDYVDRGPDSKGVIDYLNKLRKSHQLVTLKGNHESMMENARDSEQELYFWLVNGGEATLESFQVAHLDDIDPSYWKFMEDCSLYYESENHIMAHAGLEPELPLNKQPEECLLWKRIFDTEPHISDKILVCGNTSQRNGKPLVLDHAVCIDTFPAGTGWLTCLDIDNNTYWQTNEKGETRQSSL